MYVPAFDDSLRTGVAVIDEQHEWLFKLAASVVEKIGACDLYLNGEPSPYDCEEAVRDALTDAVYGLADYVTEHFEDEEALMRTAGYPGVGPHGSLHQNLSGRVTTYLVRHTNGDDIAALEFVEFFLAWLTSHISAEDRAFVGWLQQP